MKHKIAVFASGSGSNFEAICSAAERGEIPAEVALMVCDKPLAAVCERARKHNVPSFIFSAKDYESKAEYEQQIVEECQQRGVELICLAGYMRLVGSTLLNAYRGRIINLHPSLLPLYKGARAIEQAFENGDKRYGATIHYVDESLDGGEIISQQSLCYEGDSLEEVTEMIHQLEHKLYTETIKTLLSK
ncbi:MAG: phosphoribosylglycinamide formyltransferase [Alistipes sp.]|nr:phosphoribosylglycinamide formyltransferase [Alistipes sp.]